jgi:hypothetical protein
MTARHYNQLSCEITPDCENVYPPDYHDGENVKIEDLRKRAIDDGWEVRRGAHAGRDGCPDCQIKDIKARAAGKPVQQSLDEAGAES